MFKLGLPELIVIFLAVILLFGAKALPDIAKGLARAIKNFQEGMRGIGNEVKATKMKEEDPGKVITHHALNGDSELCSETLDLFVAILGAEVGNCGLKFMALGGIYLGGGIPPKILPKLKEACFLEAMTSKGRMSSVVKKMPVYVILDDKTALRGAAYTIYHK